MVAALGQLALVTSDQQELLDHVALFVAQTLDVELGAVWEASPDGTELRLRAGYGWPDGCVGQARLPATPDTQLGHTLLDGEPTMISDLAGNERFRTPELLRDQRMRSGVSVAVTLQQGRYGVLSAHAARPRDFTEDEVHFLLAVAMLLTVAMERRRAETELQKLATFAQLNPNAALELTAEAAISYHNEAALRLAASVGCAHPREILPTDIAQIIRACLETGQGRMQHEMQIAGHTLAWSFHPVTSSRVVHCYVEDSTDRLSLEAQLRQAQKMESVGQLAAGVAHDFNNLLTIIQGHAGLLLERSDLPAKLTDAAQAVYDAAERAAGLTRQLLMFSRKNLMNPRPLDLRDTVGNLSKMLQRLLGETVRLHFQSASEVPWVNADPGMIEQVLMNLAINARDAMPKGGRLTLALSTEEVDAARAAAHPQARPGRCVCLRVTDTGCGMDAATLQHIFEPFFTTKEPGKGTGLGLATVYGIVQQHNGWVEVASQVGAGTTFNVFLPAPADLAPPPPATEPPRPTAPAHGRGEHILVVEDEPMLREMVVSLLEDLQYRVVAVASGVEANRVWEEHAAAFDLLLTDMVLPEGMSGLELAASLHTRKPALKIILSSGYGMDEVGSETLRHLGARFLEKPYPSATLSRTIRECLDGE
jgi:signal transduction histidine kinase/CheY-like chemotaxis protein